MQIYISLEIRSLYLFRHSVAEMGLTGRPDPVISWDSFTPLVVTISGINGLPKTIAIPPFSQIELLNYKVTYD